MTVRGAQMSFPRASSNGWESARLRRLLAVLPRFTVDTAIVVSVVAVYFLARGQAPGRESFAVNLTSHLVAFERSLHIFWEPAIQDVSIHKKNKFI